MSEPTNKPVGRNADVWIDAAWSFLCHSYRAIIELGYGVRANTIPWITCCGVGTILSIAIALRLDRLALKKAGLLFFYPINPVLYWPYCVSLVMSPFLLWAFNQVRLRIRLMNHLKDAFVDSGLKTSSGRLPKFISNFAIDHYTHKLRLRNVGFTKAQFEKAKEPIGAQLQVYIDEVKENRSAGTVDLIYSHVGMPKTAELGEMRRYRNYQFAVGDTRGGHVIENLRDVPHLMVAGQSGGGKSTFLRQFITTLYLNNPKCQFTGIDLKGGMEFQMFEGLTRMHVVPDVREAVRALEKFESALKGRMALLRANRCKDLDAYFAVPTEKRVTTPEFTSTDLDRHIVIIDEAAEMFLAGGDASTQDIQRARRILSQIARQGRAVGIHLVIATQRPDSKSLDPQVKANLIGVLCYAMQNDTSSITVLGNGRATDLPGDVKGRAIWKKNGEMIEVQTPNLTDKEAEKILAEYRASEEMKAIKQAPALSEPTEPVTTVTAHATKTDSKM